MPEVVPVSAAVATETVLPEPTFFVSYVAVKEVSATFAALLASPAGTLTNVNNDVSVIAAAVDRLYTFVLVTLNVPPMVSGLCVMLAVKLGCVRR